MTTDIVKSFVDEAVTRFAAVGVTAGQLRDVQNIAIALTDLPNDLLGIAAAGVLVVDQEAAGWGWFIDATPWDDSEFAIDRGKFRSSFPDTGDRMDLLTFVTHEIGHLLGLHHPTDSRDHFMDELLEAGTRRLIDESILDDLTSG